MSKATGFYRKKDSSGRMVTHPITRTTGSRSYHIPQMKTYQVIPARTVEFQMVQVPVKDIQFSESRPVDLDRRATFFMDMYRNGKTIPPILVHRLPDGKYEVIDGHARLEAYRRLGITEIPAVENSIADVFKKIGGGLKAGVTGVAKGVRYGVAPAKQEGYGLAERIGAQIGAGARKLPKATLKGTGWVAGLPTGARMAYREGKALAIGREGAVTEREQAILYMQRRLAKLKRMAMSKDPFTRRMAIGKLRQEFPEELRKLQLRETQPSQPKSRDWVQELKGKGQMEGYDYY
jgi:hypothetical protein